MCTGRQRLVGGVGEEGVAGHELVVHQARDDAALPHKVMVKSGQKRLKVVKSGQKWSKELVVHQARDDAALRRQAGQIIRKYWPRTGQIRVKC